MEPQYPTYAPPGRRWPWRGRRRGYPAEPIKDRYWLHLLLFALTFATTVYMGAETVQRWLHYAEAGFMAFVADGLRFSVSLLLFLTVHEFGHYFAARRHGIATSLPYYIPIPFGVGTLGAVIRIREPIPTTRKLFDIGAAGPLAGFVVALGVLLYAFATLPPPTYLLDLPGHEAIKAYVLANGRYPETLLPEAGGGMDAVLVVGQTPLYWLLSQLFDNVPPMYEMYHYPVLFAGWLGLFFTALNLLPVGQLDGGHILYALVGPRWHGRFARTFFMLLLISGGIGYVDEIAPLLQAADPWLGRLSWFILAGILYFYLRRIFGDEHLLAAGSLLGIMAIVAAAPHAGDLLLQFGYSGWFIWCLLIAFLIKIDHPPVLYTEPLTPGRRALGLLSLVIFLLCFSFRPLYVV